MDDNVKAEEFLGVVGSESDLTRTDYAAALDYLDKVQVPNWRLARVQLRQELRAAIGIGDEDTAGKVRKAAMRLQKAMEWADAERTVLQRMVEKGEPVHA